MKRAVAGAVAGALALAPSIAAACPYCSGGKEVGVGEQIAIGAMVASPFIAVIVAVPLVVRMIRKEQSDE